MNSEQLAYQAGRLAKSVCVDPLLAALAIREGAISFQWFSQARENPNFDNIVNGTVYALAAAIPGIWTLLRVASRSKSLYHSKKIESNMADYPLENARGVIIDDKNGLDSLLERTGARKKRKWGTFLKAHVDDGTAVIHEILDIDKGISQGIIREGKGGFLDLNSYKASDLGYNGRHLYHPDLGNDWINAYNYAVGCCERYTPDNWINLKTFNIPDGQEIIAFNRNHVYLSTEAKNRFFLAEPERVMEYLER